MNKDIESFNDKGQRHGLWEYYFFGHNLWHKCFYHNDKEVGYEEIYSYLDKLNRKRYYI
jgi:hypothetical protein